MFRFIGAVVVFGFVLVAAAGLGGAAGAVGGAVAAVSVRAVDAELARQQHEAMVSAFGEKMAADLAADAVLARESMRAAVALPAARRQAVLDAASDRFLAAVEAAAGRHHPEGRAYLATHADAAGEAVAAVLVDTLAWESGAAASGQTGFDKYHLDPAQRRAGKARAEVVRVTADHFRKARTSGVS